MYAIYHVANALRPGTVTPRTATNPPLHKTMEAWLKETVDDQDECKKIIREFHLKSSILKLVRVT
jgi:hypothetical protein